MSTETIPDGWHRHTNPDGTKGGLVEDTATVANTAYVGRNACVFGNAQTYGTARVFGNTRVEFKARVSSPEHVLTIGPLGNEQTTLTAYRCKRVWRVIGGCSEAVKLGSIGDGDPFVEDYPPKSELAAAERLSGLTALRMIAEARDRERSEQENQQ